MSDGHGLAPKRLVVIDGMSIFYRGYYAMPNLSTKDGTPTGGIFGFASLSLEVLRRLAPDYVAVAWDKPKTNTRKRIEMYPAYKAGRKPPPEDFYAQIPLLHQLLEALGWPLYELDDYEADDIMGALATQAAKQGIETCLITSDLDTLQLVGPLTHVYALKKGFTDIHLYNPESFEQKYGIGVHQFIDLKALKGDSSDNIPGVPGIGEVTALKLLREYHSLDGVYNHIHEITGSTQAKLIAGKDSAYLSKKVAEIWCDAPSPLELDRMDVHDFDAARVKQLMEELEFRSLAHKLPAVASRVSAEIDDIERLDMATAKEVTEAPQAETLVVVCGQEGWYLSEDPQKVFKADERQVSDLLQNKKIIAHDVKPLIKQLMAQAVVVPGIEHDTRHAAFLIDPLSRTLSLGELLGVEITSPAEEVAAIWELYQQQNRQFETLQDVARVAHTIDFPIIPILATMEYTGILLDAQVLARMSQELSTKIAQLQSEIYELCGKEFNIASPRQLGDILYDTLGLPTMGVKKGKTGYSTGQKELDKLRSLHPIIEKIEQFREFAKLKNTYLDTLPQQRDEQGRLHTTFNQDGTATGRMNSTDPNLQNIPVRTELGRMIRTAFVSDEGNLFVSADYGQFELRLAAVLARDEQLINDFNGELDVHAKTASDVYGIPLPEVTKAQRRAAKVINFGVLYGMSPHGLAAATGMTFMDAKQFIDNYFNLRSPIRRYIEATIDKAQKEGYVETLFGRRRPTPDVNSSNFMVREGAKRAAANMPIQGTEADLLKMAMLKINQAFQQFPDPKPQMLLQIHDSILVEVKADQAEKVAALMKTTMENIYPKLGIKLSVDVSIGKNWGDL